MLFTKEIYNNTGRKYPGFTMKCSDILYLTKNYLYKKKSMIL